MKCIAGSYEETGEAAKIYGDFYHTTLKIQNGEPD